MIDEGSRNPRRDRKTRPVTQEILAFLLDVSESEEVRSPIIRRKARRLAARLVASTKRGTKPKLEPEDPGKIVSFVDRLRANGLSFEDAFACASEQFDVSARWIEHLYRELCKRTI